MIQVRPLGQDQPTASDTPVGTRLRVRTADGREKWATTIMPAYARSPEWVCDDGTWVRCGAGCSYLNPAANMVVEILEVVPPTEVPAGLPRPRVAS